LWIIQEIANAWLDWRYKDRDVFTEMTQVMP